MKLSRAEKIKRGKELIRRLSKKKQKLVIPAEPRYDEIYTKGVEWLNSL